ncbi:MULTISPECIES: hypothetical protein [Alcaligenes]|uniref:Uncharacterized protein n=1 Tax=Alcaligenes phenolicus TaxID=232846 RepID=A0AAW5VVC9_9BURK|nr:MULTISPECIES: hypothetical protein [Alcaligenes]MCR4143627.1 hypothetical protein [Alcaligenes faecalis]MCX5565182.1 hypothetical protein [Alcaligenes phenolicus]
MQSAPCSDFGQIINSMIWLFLSLVSCGGRVCVAGIEAKAVVLLAALLNFLLYVSALIGFYLVSEALLDCFVLAQNFSRQRGFSFFVRNVWKPAVLPVRADFI